MNLFLNVTSTGTIQYTFPGKEIDITYQTEFFHVRSFVVRCFQCRFRSITFVSRIVELPTKLIDLQFVPTCLLFEVTTFSIALVQLIFQLLIGFTCAAQFRLQIMNLQSIDKEITRCGITVTLVFGLT